MSQHPNARLTPKGRETLVSRVKAGLGVARTAREMGVSRQTAAKRLARAARGEPMSDRSSRPRRLARATPSEDVERVVRARSSMLLAPLALAAETGVPARTCARIVARSGLPRLADVDRVTGEVRRRGPPRPSATSATARASCSTSTSRRWPGSPTAAAGGPTGGPAGPGPGRARPACTWPSTTSAGSPMPSCCPTSARGRAPPSWGDAWASSRGWGCAPSA